MHEDDRGSASDYGSPEDLPGMNMDGFHGASSDDDVTFGSAFGCEQEHSKTLNLRIEALGGFDDLVPVFGNFVIFLVELL